MRECRGDLLERARRGLASDQDLVALDAHLASCDTCALTRAVSEDFAQVGAPSTGDAEVILRLARVARARQLGHTSPFSRASASLRGRKGALRLGLAALLISGLAAAAVVLVGARGEDTVHEPAASVGRPAHAPAVSPSSAAPPLPVVDEPPIVQEVPAEGADQRPLPALRSASDIYRGANEARRKGQVALATARYRELQKLFPSSAEAGMSRVSLGGLLLEGGSASAALGQFERYLGGPDGRLRAEALYGKGRALQALGRQAEELQTWLHLLELYPNSAYAAHAQRRRTQLE